MSYAFACAFQPVPITNMMIFACNCRNMTLSESPSATADKVPKKIVTPTPPSALDTANSTTVGGQLPDNLMD